MSGGNGLSVLRALSEYDRTGNISFSLEVKKRPKAKIDKAV